MQKTLKRALVWLRRDLRVEDHAALYHALRAAEEVFCVFVFDTDILAPLPRADRRVEFIHASVLEVDQALREASAGAGRLLMRHGSARAEIVRLAAALQVQAVYANHDDEPDALARDAAVRQSLGDTGIALHTFKDHVIFERGEVLTQGGSPYTVFTPYKNAWLRKMEPFFVKAYPVVRHAAALAAPPAGIDDAMPTLATLGFEPTNLRALGIPTGSSGGQRLFADFLTRIDDYGQARDFPSVKGPSYLSVHLRFGTVSVRALAAAALARIEATASAGATVWLSELVWRDFYHQVLHFNPHVVGASFKPGYDRIQWESGAPADARFEAWCEGRTGYPLVDAAMAQINQTGYMHNRLRMVTASFLSKDLGIDYRRGEAYFALKLNDYDLAANNGGWQWAASTGCDAQPWFRIFNPVSQSRKFDPEGKFIRRYLPALAGLPDKWIHTPWLAEPALLHEAGIVLDRDYPRPVVDHETARQATLARFGAVKGS